MRRSIRGRRSAPTLVVLTALALFATGLAGLACESRPAHLTGVGDPYLPLAGNGGYDVAHYEITLDVDPVSGILQGSTVIQAQATEPLTSFDLDFMGLTIGGLKIDGQDATYRRDGQELIMTCPQPLTAGQAFSVEVDYSGKPKAVTNVEPFPLGWVQKGDVIYTLDELMGAATWFPCNDHPSDKATYLLRITVPTPYVAAANGVLVDSQVQGTDQTFVWEMDQPEATYLAAVDIGQFTVEKRTAPNGVPIRNYFAPAVATTASQVFSRTGEMLAFYADTFGPYPFAAYGAVVPDAYLAGVSMENQTLSLFGKDFLLDAKLTDVSVSQFVISHELAHQWFGDSVSVSTWNDIWLNEGFATYASWLWLEHDQGAQALEAQVKRAQGLLADDHQAPGAPGLGGLFGHSVYYRGALTLHALRLTVGDEAFFRILREWVARYRYGNATTEDFVALAKEEAPEVPAATLDQLFEAWLYGRQMPVLPGATS